MSIQTELTRIKNAKAAIKTAIEGKGVTVPDATLLDGMASLIESIEAGGGSGGGNNTDWRGFPFLTGTFTPSGDISSAYTVEFKEGNRLRYRTINGSLAKWKPMFLLFPDMQYVASMSQGYIQNIGSFPNTSVGNDTPNNTGTIFAYIDGNSVNTTYVKGVYGLTISVTGFNVSASYQDIKITSVKIPCTSSLKLKGGLTYRWMLFAGIYAEEVSIE